MSRARAVLHLVALLAPLGAVALFAVMVSRDWQFVVRMALVFGGLGACAAQLAAFVRWPALERRAHAGYGGWITGVGMAAIAHVLFAILAVFGLAVVSGDSKGGSALSDPKTLVAQTIFFILVSILPVGIVTFPTTAVFVEWIARMRRKEFGDADV